MVYQTIEWHLEGHKNCRIYLDKLAKDIKILQDKLRESEERWAFKEKQIQEAIRLGKDKFDDDKFLVKK